MTAALDHAASHAWRRLGPSCGEPRAVEFLRRKASGTIHRLQGSGIDGSDVIAKRCRRDKVEVEHLVYRELYSRLPEPTLHYYGSIEDEDPAFGWLFLEDVGDTRYRPAVPEHRERAALWFGHAHSTAEALDLRSRLPNREPGFYREQLRDALAKLPAIVAERPLDAASRGFLCGILSACKRLERDWDRIDAFCDGLPRTLVHGNCLPKNVHVRPSGRVAPFDWGGAGWGLVGTDLGQLTLPYEGARPSLPDLASYRSIVSVRWPTLGLETIAQLANLGQLCWALRGISRAIPAFDYEWATLEDAVGTVRVYACALHDALRLAKW